MCRFLCHVFTLAVILYLPDGGSWKILVPIYIKNSFQNVWKLVRLKLGFVFLLVALPVPVLCSPPNFCSITLSWCLRNSNQQIIKQLFVKKILNKESLNHLESVQFCFLLSCRALFLIFSEMFKQKMAGFPHIFVPGQMFSDWRQRHVDVWCLKQIWKTCFVSRWSAPDIYEPSHREYCW